MMARLPDFRTLAEGFTKSGLRSALPLKADIARRHLDVRFGPEADMNRSNRDVCFTPESGHSSARSRCPLWTNIRHRTVLTARQLRAMSESRVRSYLAYAKIATFG